MIGIFDSGVGGLGVLAEIRRLLPSVDVAYVADHAAAPYGVRTLEQVERRSRLMSAWLESEGCRIVTLACNTASAAALRPLRRDNPHLVFVGMEPAVKPAVELTGTGRVGVVATAATFQGELFASVVDRFAAGVEVLTAACPRWVELVEAGKTAGPKAEREVRRCLQPMIERGVDVLVLACTHYPALSAVISRVMGPSVQVIDPSPAVARQAVRLASSLGHHHGEGRTRLMSTADPSALSAAARRLGIDTAPALLPLG
jgi:glutamate racemase